MPTDSIDDPTNYDRGHRMYGMLLWRNLFSARQLLTHGTGVEIFRELLDEAQLQHSDNDLQIASFVYLSLSLDKMINYNSRMSIWFPTREVVVNTFNRHNFAFSWSYAEMAPLIQGLGFDWALEQTAKCIDELVALTPPRCPRRQHSPTQPYPIYASQHHHHLQAGRRPRPHRKRHRGRHRHGPALL